MRAACLPAMVALLGVVLSAPRARAGETAPADPDSSLDVVASGQAADADSPRPAGLEALVPELSGDPYHLESGVRPFVHRLSFSPGFGSLGSERLFAFRVAYNPNSWLGYEGLMGHNPAQSVHAALHMVSAILRRPRPGRFQPYVSAGYGMMMVYPGRSLNASPVTKNAVSAGGGLEFYVRGDLALRAEARSVTVFGRQGGRDGVVAFDYFERTIGLAFYRSIRP